MEKLEMDQYLFHGIFACSIDPDISKMEAEILKSILVTKMIASRKILKTLLSEEDYKRIVTTPTENWNGDSYVSVSAHINRISSLLVLPFLMLHPSTPFLIIFGRSSIQKKSMSF